MTTITAFRNLVKDVYTVHIVGQSISLYDEDYLSKLDCYYEVKIKANITGLKRLIYGIWNNGENEKGESMVDHMYPEEKRMYFAVCSKYHKFTMPKINIEGLWY